MMARSNWTAARDRRRGMLYLEAVVASLVFALTLAGLGASLVAQEKLMRAVEQRAYVLVRSDRRAELVRVEDDPSPGGFWETAKLDATSVSAVPEAEVGSSIEWRAYGLMERLGRPPAILEVVDNRPDRWPDAGRGVQSLRIVWPDGLTAHPWSPLAAVELVDSSPEPGTPGGAVVVVVKRVPTAPDLGE